MFRWLEPTCRLCKTLVSTAVIHRDHLLLPLQRGNPVRKGNRSSRRSQPNTGPSPETSANIYGDNTIQRGCVSDRAGQPCQEGRGGRSLERTFWMLPRRKSKRRKKNKKAAFSSSLPAKAFAEAGRHLIQKSPLGTVPHGIMQGQGCCGAEAGASRDQPWCWGFHAPEDALSSTNSRYSLGPAATGDFSLVEMLPCLTGAFSPIIKQCLLSSSKCRPQAPPPGPARVPSDGCVPVCLTPVYPTPSTAVGYEGEDISTWTAVTPSCSTTLALWGTLALASMGLEVWPLPALFFTFHLVSSLIHLF